MEFLYNKLKKYHKKNIYPFHMPGHKRNEESVDFLPGLAEDITEIEGFDYLHRPDGVLREAQRSAALLYGADETFYSVNGSTGALLAAVSGCTAYGGAILMARNCHQSVYHGVALRQLDSYYLYPKIADPYGLNCAVDPAQVAEALAVRRDVQAVLITSPTYDGVVSPVKEIAEVVHSYRLPLIVDEAHGAHFPFHGYFPDSALAQGADVVVHSLHKTLPALTQTALLHIKSDLVDSRQICRFMGIYQSSSPSYLLMGSMDACIQKIQQSGSALFDTYVDRLKRLRARLSGFGHLELVGAELVGSGLVWDFDRSKLILAARGGKMSGHQLYGRLWKNYGLQMEMETEAYVLGMTSVADTEEGYERLCCALEDIEKEWEKTGQGAKRVQKIFGKKPEMVAGEQVLSIGKAMEQSCIRAPLEESVGRVAGDFLYLYPPGIPLTVPGERITSQLAEQIRRSRQAGLEVRGLMEDGGSGEGIAVSILAGL